MSIRERISWTSRLIGWNSHWALFTWWKSFRLTRSVTEFAQEDLQQCPRFILASETRGKLVFFIQSKSICVYLIDSRPCLWFQLLRIVFENINVDWSISDRHTHCLDMLSWHQQLLLCSSLLVRRSLYCQCKGGCCRGCPTISAIQQNLYEAFGLSKLEVISLLNRFYVWKVYLELCKCRGPREKVKATTFNTVNENNEQKFMRI